MDSKKPAAKGEKHALSKAEFVRSLPNTLSATEVIQKAAAEGVKLSSTYVYKVRASSKAPKKPKAAAKKRASTTKGQAARKGTKTSFVLGLPSDLTASEVVEKGKSQGVHLTTKHVYTIRSSAKKSSKGHTARKVAPTAHRAAVKAPAPSSHVSGPNRRVETEFLKSAVSLGLARATELLSSFKHKVDRLAEG